jgi:hypothetical protein
MDNHDIITAVQYGDFRTVREYIGNRIYSPNSTDIDGCSLLHWYSLEFPLHHRYCCSPHHHTGLPSTIESKWFNTSSSTVPQSTTREGS